MICLVEELSMNAMPSLQTLLYDGWILRFANGYTKRANSINPIYPGTGNVEEKIETCEKIYQKKGLNVVYKMTSINFPKELDAILNARGYRLDSDTSVQLLSLEGLELPSVQEVVLTTDVDDEWLSAFYRLSGIKNEFQPILQQMIHSIVPMKCFASVRSESKIIACGLGVLQNNFLGLFDIVTDINYRRRGFAEQLVRNLLMWGKIHGAHKSYLQVMLNNAPALNLYSKLGFREEYRYWYRIK